MTASMGWLRSQYGFALFRPKQMFAFGADVKIKVITKTMKRIKGIYLIERITKDNDQDKKVYYIGMAVDIFDRWHQHCVNEVQFIDTEIKRYGKTNFSFRILEEVKYKKDLKKAESKWIKYYKDREGEEKLYNISETSNKNPTLLDPNIKKKIKDMFIEDIGRSIYAVAEECGVSFRVVIEERAPLLTTMGLKYDKKTKKIVYISNGEPVPDWRGSEPTENLKIEIDNRLIHGQDTADLISDADLKLYKEKKSTPKTPQGEQ